MARSHSFILFLGHLMCRRDMLCSDRGTCSVVDRHHAIRHPVHVHVAAVKVTPWNESSLRAYAWHVWTSRDVKKRTLKIKFLLSFSTGFHVRTARPCRIRSAHSGLAAGIELMKDVKLDFRAGRRVAFFAFTSTAALSQFQCNTGLFQVPNCIKSPYIA